MYSSTVQQKRKELSLFSYLVSIFPLKELVASLVFLNNNSYTFIMRRQISKDEIITWGGSRNSKLEA